MIFRMRDVGFETETEYGTLQVAGNSEYGFRPYQLMAASIAVCSGGVMRTILDKKRISYEDITMEAHIERNEKEANRITKIAVHFTIKADISEEQMHKVMELTTKNCSMVQSVKDSIEIVETFQIVK
ncbi:OsmC family protein [Ectobacillus antri]|jgi:putative redox protein|uniref:OsmC family protein n=1 Tax=Ectobacillus antri TaxID=2486280 RepID=A0ABT6H8M3_9BACI|nr:OsmC family protein [Ectobacillus antri]MDG4657924.1 OsmC family protein [Ectobacillus antri]MDG5754992.1 OsmC family protein [Ectobacillus antri]